MAEDVFDSTLEHLGLYQSLVDGLLQVFVVGTEGEVHVVAAIDGSSGFCDLVLQIWQLVDGGVVTHHHTVEAYVVAKDVLQDLAVSDTPDAMHIMITWHDTLAASQTDHRLVGQEDLFHQFLLVGITTTAVAEVVFRAGSHTFLQVALLQPFHECDTHDGREIAILTVGLLQTVE